MEQRLYLLHWNLRKGKRRIEIEKKQKKDKIIIFESVKSRVVWRMSHHLELDCIVIFMENSILHNNLIN